MAPEIIALAAFLFVSMSVGGVRIINRLDAMRASREADRRRQIAARANRNDYHGPLYSQRGAEIGE